MVKFYLNRIEKGLITIAEVPKYWKEKVESELVQEQ